MPPRSPESRLSAERRSQLRGLLYLALLAALFVILRYGPSHLFASGWWRLW